MTTDPVPYEPKVSPSIRTAVYFAALIFGTVGILATGIVRIWYSSELGTSVENTVSVINNALLFLTGALGVAYRPTK